MINNFLKILVASTLILLFSCKQNTPVSPYIYDTNPQYTWGFTQYFGDYYSNYDCSNNVLALNLLVSGLTVNSESELVGTGQYLILEDVFISPTDTIFAEGTYTAADSLINLKPFTFLKGKAFKENSSTADIPSGAYIYYFESDPTKNAVKYIIDGSFSLTIDKNNTYQLQCNFITNDKKELKGTFRGKLGYFNEKAHVKSGAKRKTGIQWFKR